LRLGELAARIGGVLHGDPAIEVTGVAGIREAGAGDLTFLADPRYEAAAATTRAAAILVSANHRRFAQPVIEHPDPFQAFFAAVALLHPPPPPPPAGVHPTAVVGPGVRLGEAASIGPHAVIEAGAEIGDRAIVGALVYIGRQVRIGADTYLYPQVVIREECVLGDRVIVHSGAVIGSDGYGFRHEGERHVKVPQIGRVVIGDDVEIGAACAIDRGTLGDTVIERGTKFDNLVHIGHNVRIGADSLVIAQVGIGGSAVVGKGVILAGQAGIAGHIEIGDRAQIGGQAGVIASVPAGEQLWGTPAMPLHQSKRVYAAIRRTPELLREVRALKERVAALEAAIQAAGRDGAPGGAPPAARGRDRSARPPAHSTEDS
jgi:UDP-3-O-[3-hydroxymyristoyl] glucosamine N-acyltransferase